MSGETIAWIIAIVVVIGLIVLLFKGMIQEIRAFGRAFRTTLIYRTVLDLC